MLNLHTRQFYLGLLLTAGVITSWLTYSISDDEPLKEKIDPHQLTSYMRQVELRQMNHQGKLERILHSPQLARYGKKSDIQITQPRFLIFSTNQNVLKVKSQKATLTEDGTYMRLIGNVQLDQAADAKHPALSMRTELLDIFPKKHFMTTDKAVTITRAPDVVMHAIGLKGYFKENRLQLLSHVRGVYEPAS